MHIKSSRIKAYFRLKTAIFFLISGAESGAQ